MRVVDQLNRVLAEGHDDDALVGVPIGMVRQIARRLEADDQRALREAAFGDVCASIGQRLSSAVGGA